MSGEKLCSFLGKICGMPLTNKLFLFYQLQFLAFSAYKINTHDVETIMYRPNPCNPCNPSSIGYNPVAILTVYP